MQSNVYRACVSNPSSQETYPQDDFQLKWLNWGMKFQDFSTGGGKKLNRITRTKVKLSLYLTKYHAMEMYWGVEV